MATPLRRPQSAPRAPAPNLIPEPLLNLSVFDLFGFREHQPRHHFGNASRNVFNDHLQELQSVTPDKQVHVVDSDSDSDDDVIFVEGRPLAFRQPVSINLDHWLEAKGHPSRVDVLQIGRSIVPRDQPPRLEPNCDIELRDGSFMRIKSLEYDDRDTVHAVKGLRFLPQGSDGLLMPDRKNEIICVVKLDKGDLDFEWVQSSAEARHVVRNILIVFTNQPYKNLNYTKDVERSSRVPKPIFFCRYVSTDENVPIDGKKISGPPTTGRIEHLRAEDVVDGTIVTHSRQEIPRRIADRIAREQWRGREHANLHGSHKESKDGLEIQEYTFGDAFAGAGGTSEGARAAGLKLIWALDFDQRAYETYVANFGHLNPLPLHEDVCTFVQWAVHQSAGFVVDILHLSPPCQPFCGSNRRPNLEKMRQQLEAFSKVGEILHIARPRLVTLEETKGLTDIDKRQWFRQLICAFVDAGYSVQWRTVLLGTYGVPQSRNRLIIMAAGPGEMLPPFSRPTHGPEHGLGPYPSALDTINTVPVDATYHEPENHLFTTPRPPLKAEAVCPTIMTQLKPSHYHPFGHRGYTIRELATLQTFPHEFIFEGNEGEQLRQIGNAVPPRFAEIMYRYLRGSLREADLAETRERRA